MAKGHQRDDWEQRDRAYQEWRHGKGSAALCAQDLDCVEYRYMGGHPIPVAVLELTRIDSLKATLDGQQVISIPPQTYFDRIIERYGRGQGKAVMAMAQRLNCCAYIVGYTEDLSIFHVFNLHRPHFGWKRWSQDQYWDWIKGLRPRQQAAGSIRDSS
tara:strand:+ start:1756 stop:2229 length:474 start_codon:yes stop_codon:yes gene_type:complete